ncbi:MAG: tyrosine-type recombinase/integrase [Acidobacteria bacterium]|nr:tyrosine-type recombinase/integrase [Acidobacteriota bacterium]MCW5949819.1 tyrosine-type recombinase/integrase [Pyrinomonadaceae bacterium]
MTRSREGSVYRAADGRRWIARLRYTDAAGRRREMKRVCGSHAAAKATIVAMRETIHAPTETRKSFSDLIAFYRATYVHAARYVAGQKISGFRQNLATVNYYLASAASFFADKYLDQITYAALEDYRAHLFASVTRTGGPRSIADVNQHLRKLRRVLNVAIEQGWLATNPFSRGRTLIATAGERERTRVITRTEETRLLEQCTGRRKHLRDLIVFAIETAARRGEIEQVRWRAVDLDRRIITLEQSTTKTLRSRSVPISARLAATLRRMRSERLLHPTAFVFGRSDHKRAWRSAVKAAGLGDLRFHDLRHTAITRMLEAGISPPLVMRISGHTQHKTFMRYVNPSDDSIAAIANVLDAAAG